MRVERWAIRWIARATAYAAGALHDLHTGDAQEYLLFLIGLGVFAVILPLLR